MQSLPMLKVKSNEDITSCNYLQDTTAWWKAGHSCWRQSYWFLCSPSFDGQNPPDETHFSPEKQSKGNVHWISVLQTHTSVLEYHVSVNKYRTKHAAKYSWKIAHLCACSCFFSLIFFTILFKVVVTNEYHHTYPVDCLHYKLQI